MTQTIIYKAFSTLRQKQRFELELVKVIQPSFMRKTPVEQSCASQTVNLALTSWHHSFTQAMR